MHGVWCWRPFLLSAFFSSQLHTSGSSVTSVMVMALLYNMLFFTFFFFPFYISPVILRLYFLGSNEDEVIFFIPSLASLLLRPPISLSRAYSPFLVCSLSRCQLGRDDEREYNLKAPSFFFTQAVYFPCLGPHAIPSALHSCSSLLFSSLLRCSASPLSALVTPELYTYPYCQAWCLLWIYKYNRQALLISPLLCRITVDSLSFNQTASGMRRACGDRPPLLQRVLLLRRGVCSDEWQQRGVAAEYSWEAPHT